MTELAWFAALVRSMKTAALVAIVLASGDGEGRYRTDDDFTASGCPAVCAAGGAL